MKHTVETINLVLIVTMVISSLLKVLFTYLHAKKTQGVQPRKLYQYGDIRQYQQINEYLRLQPIYDTHKSVYKTTANWLVISIYVYSIVFLIINANTIYEALEAMQSLP